MVSGTHSLARLVYLVTYCKALMRGLFAFSYFLLWGLIVLQAILLREVLLKTVKYKRLVTTIKRNSRVEEISWLRKGAPIPEFAALSPARQAFSQIPNSEIDVQYWFLFQLWKTRHSIKSWHLPFMGCGIK